jgi:HlyD family secretion protein
MRTWTEPRRWRCAALVGALVALGGCQRNRAPAPLLGSLEWDRIGIAAEVSEPIIAIAVKEGDSVVAGTLLLELDARRADAQLAQAQAEQHRAEAALAELAHGARSETIAATRAELARTQVVLTDTQRERARAGDLRSKGLNAQVDLDRADTAMRSARAAATAAQARLEELTHGTRAETLDQAEATLVAASAHAQELRLTRERLSVRAPATARVDALPFKLGDQPPKGATVVSLLAGEAPYARLFVPEAQRAGLKAGAKLRVRVEGVATPFEATVVRLASEAAFTPYYALSGDDASRLSWRAEAQLSGDAAKSLPAGLPVQAEIVGNEQH